MISVIQNAEAQNAKIHLPQGSHLVTSHSQSRLSNQRAELACDLFDNKIEGGKMIFAPPVASAKSASFGLGKISPVLLSVTFPEPFQEYQVDFWQFVVGFGETGFREVPYIQGIFSKSETALPDYRDAAIDVDSASTNSKITLRGTTTISDSEFLSFLCSTF
jgi:hypothetical protein